MIDSQNDNSATILALWQVPELQTELLIPPFQLPTDQCIFHAQFEGRRLSSSRFDVEAANDGQRRLMVYEYNWKYTLGGSTAS